MSVINNMCVFVAFADCEKRQLASSRLSVCPSVRLSVHMEHFGFH